MATTKGFSVQQQRDIRSDIVQKYNETNKNEKPVFRSRSKKPMPIEEKKRQEKEKLKENDLNENQSSLEYLPEETYIIKFK